MEKIERHLDLTVRSDGETVEVDVFEPESGLTKTVANSYSPDEHPEFSMDLGDEIYSWINVWMDAIAGGLP